MAMLAEPRRKQRVGPNPRGKFFTEDEDNKGRHLLQKMGWKSGDGLGVERQGIRDPIKPKIQSDAKGLGFDVKNDAWVSHTDDFNAILQNLQVAHGVNVKDEEDVEEVPSATVGFGFDLNSAGHGSRSSKPSSDEDKARLSLESKSKTSRSRIHYHKIIKNKDLSKIKDKDWSCIFGKDVKGFEKEVTQEDIKTVPPPTPPSFDYSSLLSGNSIQNRFKLQMLKSFTKSTLLEDKIEPYDGTEVVVKKSEEPEQPEGIQHEEPEPKKKKSRSKNKEKSLGSPVPLEVEVVVQDIIENEGEEPKKKKKKRSKNKEEAEPSKPVVEPEECVEFEEEPRKKKKKSKRMRSSSPQTFTIDADAPTTNEVVAEDGSEAAPTKKKKKSKNARPSSPETAVVEAAADEVFAEDSGEAPPTKKKKKSKKRSPSPEQDTITNEEIQSQPEPEPSTNSDNSIAPPADDVSSSASTNFNKLTISAEEMHAAAAVFKGSNLLQIPGYRNQSSKLL